MVGKPKAIVRGREMTGDETTAYVREVATAKTAALRMSLDAVERQAMPFRGESGGIGAGQGMGTVPGGDAAATIAAVSHREIPLDPALKVRLDEVRRSAADHATHGSPGQAPGMRRAPRPERLQR
jgi:hypothetical protein